MPLRRRISLILSIACLLHLAAVLLVASHVLLPRVEWLQRQEANNLLERCTQAIHRELEHLSVFCQDWAAWDDAYQFVMDGNAGFIATNLTPEVLANNRLSLVCFCDRRGRFVWKHKVHSPAETSQTGALFDAAALPATHPLLRLPENTSQVSGLLDTPDGPVLVASRPIVKSDNSGAIRGVLIMARRLDDAALRSIAEQTRLTLRAWTRSGSSGEPIPAPLRRFFTRCAETGYELEPQAQSDNLFGYGVLRDLNREPLLLLQADIPGGLPAQARATVRFAAWSNIGAAVALVTLVWLLLQGMIVKPLRDLSGYARRVESTTRVELCPARERNDEIGTLAAAFDRMVRSLAAALDTSNDVRGEQARALSLLLDLSNQLGSAEDVPTLLEHSIRASCELTCSPRVSILIPDPGKPDSLIMAGQIGMEPELARTVRLPVGAPIAGQSYANQSLIVCNTPEELARFGHRSDPHVFLCAPLICSPLLSGGNVAGVIALTGRADRRPYSPAEIDNVATISNMTATAITNVKTRRARDQAYESVVRALATLVEYRDSDTGYHLERVTQYALLLARALRDMGASEITDLFCCHLRLSVPLHDIGKVGIPDRILCKPDRLSPNEIAIMREHSTIGGNALRAMTRQADDAHFLAMAADIALHHHERWDGRGYPEGLAGLEIPLAARLVAVADVYDALRSRRPYKEPFSHHRSRELILEGSGTQFDPQVVSAFVVCEEAFCRLAEQLPDEAPPLPSPEELVAV